MMRSLSSSCVNEIVRPASPPHSRFIPLNKSSPSMFRYRSYSTDELRVTTEAAVHENFRASRSALLASSVISSSETVSTGAVSSPHSLSGKSDVLSSLHEATGSAKANAPAMYFQRCFILAGLGSLTNLFTNVKIEDKNRITMKSVAWYKHLMKKYHSYGSLSPGLGDKSRAVRVISGC